MNIRLCKFLATLLSLSTAASLALANGEPTLTIKNKKGDLKFTRSQLLARKSVKNIVVKDEVTGKATTFTVVPAAELFNGVDIPADSTIVFRCLDGFSAPIAKARLLNSSPTESIAYVAIEKPGDKWPSPKPGQSQTIGPYYLVWENPEKSGIAAEEWPFQLVGFEIKPAVEVQFPHIIPDRSLATDHEVNRGFQVFLKQCFACHTMNLEGKSEMGPDLNVPMNPTEYLSVVNLKKQIRNNQDVRHWPQAKMSTFPVTDISHAELDDLVSYLKYMAKHKVQTR